MPFDLKRIKQIQEIQPLIRLYVTNKKHKCRNPHTKEGNTDNNVDDNNFVLTEDTNQDFTNNRHRSKSRNFRDRERKIEFQQPRERYRKEQKSESDEEHISSSSEDW